MKTTIASGLFALLYASSASAEGLYFVGNEAQESLPLKWVVGASVIYDDNVNPGVGDKQSSVAINPYVGLSFVNITPQTTWDVYARLGLIYYFDQPVGGDNLNSQSRLGVNLTHRFSERLRFASRNFIAYELEPDYSYGYASARQSNEYFYWQTDNSIGFRWTERLATYTGFNITGANYDVPDNDRLTWEVYNQFRYQLTPNTVLTADYRYSQTEGNGQSSNSTDQYFLVGAEHRFSPNTIGIVRAGVQLRDVDDGADSTSPYLEFALNSQVNEQFSVRSFVRYGMEYYETVVVHPTSGLSEFDDRRTLRVGVSGEYVLSPVVSLFSGIDYVPAQYQAGRQLNAPYSSVSDLDENVINAFLGASFKFTDRLTGSVTYNYTHSDSDIAGRTYDRNRVSLGVSAEF